jgi:hypothetical protein
VNSWEEVLQIKEFTHTKLLEGSELDEPEGFVVWLDNTNIGIKLKHLEYYVSHKPYSKSNIEMAKEIEFSEKYSKLRPRLIKFKPKPPLITLIKNNLDLMLDLFLDNYKHLSSKKNWALFWKEKNNIQQINDILEKIESNVIIYYPQFRNSIKEKGFTITMEYFDKRDEFEEYFKKKYFK